MVELSSLVQERPTPIDPRTVNLAALNKVNFGDIGNLPHYSGLYLVLTAEKVLYVGQAGNIHQRWNKGHHKGLTLGQFTDAAMIACLECPEKDLKASEDLFIGWFDPPFNETLSKEARFQIRRSLSTGLQVYQTQRDADKLDRLIEILSSLPASESTQEALQIAFQLKGYKKVSLQQIPSSAVDQYAKETALLRIPPSEEVVLPCKSAETFFDRKQYRSEGEFDRFWAVVKKRVNKSEAKKAFQQATGVEIETMISALEKQQAYHLKKNGHLNYLSNPANWLKNRRWEDE